MARVSPNALKVAVPATDPSAPVIVLMSLGLIAATSNSIRATGGGWIETEDGDRATFSVIAECEEPNASGNFTFRDGSEDVRVRGTIVACNTIAGEGEEGVLNLVATFTTSSGETGWADIALFDRQPDILQLRLLEADELFYAEGNVLGGGNIRIDWATD